MEQTIMNMVQGQIGYTFQNPDLLRQAFTRRSYTQENGGENNEVLEFIGDKALDLAVVQLLIREFGKMNDGSPAVPDKSAVIKIPLSPPDAAAAPNEFSCSRDEGELTKIKTRMVEKRYLARKMEGLGFAKYIIMGEGDRKNDIGSGASVQEDLFEAIIGAVTLDCGWELSKICSVVEGMLNINDFLLNDGNNNYVQMIQEWEESVNHTLPLYWFREGSHSSVAYQMDIVTMGHGAVFQTSPSYDDNVNYYCDLKLLDELPVFRGWGTSKSKARMNVCKLAYEYLCREGFITEPDIRDEIDEPTEIFAINQLEILSRRGYFSLPKYDFEQEYDKDGNPIWQCRCSIEGYPPQTGEKCSSKRDAKKSAALKMLFYVLDHYESRQNAEGYKL